MTDYFKDVEEANQYSNANKELQQAEINQDLKLMIENQIKDLSLKFNNQDEVIETLIIKSHNLTLKHERQEKQIKELSQKINTQDDVIENLLVNNQDFIIKIENQENQIKELVTKLKDQSILINSKVNLFQTSLFLFLIQLTNDILFKKNTII
jgi:uncharacterized coiled-coil protein SlyX